jgi:hypothetical protein
MAIMTSDGRRDVDGILESNAVTVLGGSMFNFEVEEEEKDEEDGDFVVDVGDEEGGIVDDFSDNESDVAHEYSRLEADEIAKFRAAFAVVSKV